MDGDSRAGGQAGGWGGLEGCIRGRGLADGREATMYPGPAALISLIPCVAQDSLSPGTLPMFGTRPFAAARGARTASALLCCRPWPRPRPRGACSRTAPARSCTPLPACLAAEPSVHRALRLGRARLCGLVESEGVLLPRANPAGSRRRIPASACAAIRRIHSFFHGRPGHGPAHRLGTGRPDPSLQYLHPHRLLRRHRRLRLPVRPRAHPRRSRARTRDTARPSLGRSSSGRARVDQAADDRGGEGGRACCSACPRRRCCRRGRSREA